VKFASSLGLAALLFLGGCGGDGTEGEPGGAAPARTPVILVSLDTLRAGRLTPYGSERDNSPRLAGLAAESVLFENCISQSSSTGPSHRSLFTGQFVHRHGHEPLSLVKSPYMMAGILERAGYQTAAFTGGGYLSHSVGFAQGFDLYYDHDPKVPHRVRLGFQLVLPRAKAWYEARDPARPFFLFLHTYDIHCPYWPHQPWRDKYRGDYRGSLDLEHLCGYEAFGELRRKGALGPADLRFINDMYDGSINMTDERLGGFLDELRADGTLDRALLIVLSDHGESLGEHGIIGHTLMWEEELRVPMIIRFPGGKFAGNRIGAPVMLIDVLPTLLDFLGLPPQAGVQGRSLMPLLRGEADTFPAERMRITQYEDTFAVRFDDRWKIAFRQMDAMPVDQALYDLENDPGETTNLFHTPDGRERFQDLYARYRSFREETASEDRKWRGRRVESEIDPVLRNQIRELGY